MDEGCFVVALGGSAGSLDPLKEFFAHTPPDSAAYVIVRHLPKDCQSQLERLLQPRTKLQVLQAEDGMPVLTNRIYISPSHKRLIIKEGKFRLVQPPEGPNRAIDLFFGSLAAEKLGGHAIGVLLSGTGSDGTMGAVAISDAGGMVIAQDPGSCAYDTMPASAIQSGAVDQVKLPSEMPAAIEAYVQSRMVRNVRRQT